MTVTVTMTVKEERRVGRRRERAPGWMMTIVVLAAAIGTSATAQVSETPFEAALRTKACATALEIAQGWVAEHPDAPIAHFRLACALVCDGAHDAAIDALLASAARGYAGIRTIRDSALLDPLRAHARFADVVAAVQANVDRRLEVFRAALAEHEPAIARPAAHDPARPTPLLIVLHGTGGTGAEMLRAWRAAAARHDMLVIAPDALRPAGDGFSWVYRDESELLVLEMIERARKESAIGPVILAGFSQGANIALMLGQSHPDRFDAVIPVCGHYEADVATCPTDGTRPRWALIMGARDPWAATYVEAARTFTDAGMAVRHDVVNGMGHAMPRGARGTRVLADALAWCLAGAEAERESDAPAPATPPARASPRPSAR